MIVSLEERCPRSFDNILKQTEFLHYSVDMGHLSIVKSGTAQPAPRLLFFHHRLQLQTVFFDLGMQGRP